MVALIPTNSQETTQYLSFRLDDEEYAVAILQVREILRYEPITKVPTTPAFIRGVINIRGRVVPIIDLAVKFGLAQREVTKWTCLVVVEVSLEGEDTVMGLLVDSVHKVLEFAPEEVEVPPVFGPRIHVDYLLGMGKVSHGFVMLLDLDRVLSAGELAHADSLRDLEMAELDEAPDDMADEAPDEMADEMPDETADEAPDDTADEMPDETDERAPPTPPATDHGPDHESG